MPSEFSGSVTKLLRNFGEGDKDADNRLWLRVYDELCRRAKGQLARETSFCTMQCTALVDGAYERLVGKRRVEWPNRRYFYGAAAKAMRRILVEEARRRLSPGQGGGKKPVKLGEEVLAPERDAARFLDLNEAISVLQSEHPRTAEVVVLRFFAGLTVEKTAAAIGVASRTVNSEWQFAKAWLHRRLQAGYAI